VTGHQHRRGVLGALAGIAAAGAAAPAQAAPDPVLALVDRAETFQRQADALEAVGDEDGASELWHRRFLADEDVLATAPTTLAGLAQQLRIMADRLEIGTRGEADSDDVRKLMRYATALAGRAAA
jgi:hypothetical protein